MEDVKSRVYVQVTILGMYHTLSSKRQFGTSNSSQRAKSGQFLVRKEKDGAHHAAFKLDHGPLALFRPPSNLLNVSSLVLKIPRARVPRLGCEGVIMVLSSVLF